MPTQICEQPRRFSLGIFEVQQRAALTVVLVIARVIAAPLGTYIPEGSHLLYVTRQLAPPSRASNHASTPRNTHTAEA